MADNVSEIFCPACGEKMVKIFMPAQGVNLDVCVNGCGGIYFDNREFSKFDEPHNDISPLLDILKNKEFKQIDQSKTRKCPVCRTNMVKNFSNASKEIEVDECYSCGGKFLDNKELIKIREQYSSYDASTEQVMQKLYEDLGIQKFKPVDYASRNKLWVKGLLIGLFFGIIVSFAILYKLNILSHLNDKEAISYAFAVTVGICLIFSSTGALFSKFNKI